MTNRMLNRYIRSFKDARQGWIDILVKNPDSRDAPANILAINTKIEFLRSVWNWSEDGEEQE